MTREINNGQDIIDSRDVIARLRELEEEREALQDVYNEIEDGEDKESALIDINEWDEENGEELKALKALADEGENSAGDWQCGATLIRETYFVDYCQDLLTDIGDLPKDIPHYIAIDWDQTAENIKQDYSTIDFDGVDYLVRS